MAKTLGSLAIGDVVEMPVKANYQDKLGKYIALAVVGNETYLSGSKLMFAEKIIAYLPYDAKEAAGDSNEDFKTYGNGLWSVSNARGWLNSDAEPGKWYKKLHIYDQPPTAENVKGNPYDSWPGFLYMLDQRVLEYIGESKYKSAYRKSTDGYGIADLSTKVFLPSGTEIGQKYVAYTEGNAIQEAINRIDTTGTEEAYNTATTKPSDRKDFWTRTMVGGFPSNVGTIDNDQAMGATAFFGGKGVRPMMSILNTAPISDQKNSRGNYEFSFNEAPTAPTGIVAPETCYSSRPLEISWGAATDPEGDQITYYLERSVNSASYTQVTSTAGLTYTESNVSKEWNTLQYRVRAYDGTDYSSYITSGTIAVVHNRPPVLSGEDGDLGEKSINVSYRYTVTDPDGDSVSITETVDSKTLRTYTARLGEENELDISGDNFTALSIGTHTITITAKDAAGNTTTRTLTFTKTITGFSVTLREPLPADTMPTRCFVNVSREIPFGALFQVEACNNPNDTSPVWEDITAAVLASHVHVFANDTDHGLQHGFNIRVTVERKSDLGECWIGGIGGNFE